MTKTYQSVGNTGQHAIFGLCSLLSTVPSSRMVIRVIIFMHAGFSRALALA